VGLRTKQQRGKRFIQSLVDRLGREVNLGKGRNLKDLGKGNMHLQASRRKRTRQKSVKRGENRDGCGVETEKGKADGKKNCRKKSGPNTRTKRFRKVCT